MMSDVVGVVVVGDIVDGVVGFEVIGGVAGFALESELVEELGGDAVSSGVVGEIVCEVVGCCDGRRGLGVGVGGVVGWHSG